MKHKVLLVLLLGIIISVSASAQKVTMNLKQVKLEKVFSAITQQTGLTVAYSRTIVNPDRIVTVEAKNQELSKVLNDLFLGTNVNYEIGKTKIYLKEKVTDSEQQASNANKRNISGRVVDEKGEPIIGASVMVKGSSLGTITNVDGRYTLANVPESSTITVSYIGYITVNYVATSRNLSQVVLREDSKTLEEVVVVGYGTQKKVNLTGAVAIVSGDELTTRSAANLSQLLQGSVPNMNVNFSSGRPGQGGSFNIRGVNSISADAAPLTIIDGIEGDINKVNPNDVESISVLKDASSTAIYVFTITVVFGLQYVLVPVNMLTQGGPDQGSSNLVYIVYQYGFIFFQTGKSAAFAIITMFCYMAFLYLKNKYLEKKVYYEN